MLLCILDDRASMEPGICLLLASLRAHSPALAVRVYFEPMSALVDAAVAAHGRAERHPFPRAPETTGKPEASGWNVKPAILLGLLAEGHDEIVWIDSDVILAGDIGPLVAAPPETIVLTEEAIAGGYHDGDADRARLWGFPVGRRFPHTLNTCVLRVTQRHRALIEAWQGCLGTERYRTAAAAPAAERSPLILSDQDVLHALLCAEAHAGIPVRILKRGRDILQLYGLKGFTLRERARALWAGLPPILHAQGRKPWLPTKGAGLFLALMRVSLDVSPYTSVARRHRAALEGRDGWLRARTVPGRVLRWLGFGNPALTGLPLAALLEAVFAVTAARRRLLAAIRGRQGA